MAKVIVLGAGISGHTAAALLKRKLGKNHEVIVISPSEYYQWIPSNIWLGVGKMTIEQVRFKLKPVYDKWKIEFKQAKALAIFPEGDGDFSKPYVTIEYTDKIKRGETERVEYDYLVNATGPKLNLRQQRALALENSLTLFAPVIMPMKLGQRYRNA